MPATREHEHRLYDHYKRSANWLQGTEQPDSLKVSED